jgi:hypothetical protein
VGQSLKNPLCLFNLMGLWLTSLVFPSCRI